MSVALAEAEAWDLVAGAHTGILATTRADGHPVPIPVWFVVLDRAIYVRALSKTRKVAHIRRDRRASFLVEDGEQWNRLRAVLMVGEATVVEEPDVVGQVTEAMAAKYRTFRPPRRDLPDATRRHYASGTTTICFRPTEPVVSWDNGRIERR